MIDLETFNALPAGEIAGLLEAAGSQVCCFPINGTRRWYLFEAKPGEDYLGQVTRRHIEIYKLLIDHGLTTIIAPFFGTELLSRGEEYMKLAAKGLENLAEASQFLDFYAEAGARVHFYGDHRRQLASTPYAYLSDLFDKVTDRTRHNRRSRMFFGVFAGNGVKAAADFSVQHYAAHGSPPTERQVIEHFYGEPIERVSLFIGFDKPSVFDMPLLSTDETDLYFTASPSLYVDERQLRLILYDHLFLRRLPEPDYETLSAEARASIEAYYKGNLHNIQGVGRERNGMWFPL